MRLRLLLPRRGGGRGLRGLNRRAVGAALGAVLAIGVAVLALLFGGGDDDGAPPTRVAPPAQPPGLAVGVTEANPHLYAPGAQPAAFAPWRDRLVALKPRYLRLLVDWNRVQGEAGAPPDWTQGADGCLRGLGPCEPYGGVAEQLRAAKAAGLEVVVTFLGTPRWAAGAKDGCEPRGTQVRARMTDDLGAYRALLRSLAELAEREGVAISWWSPWNEPNHPAFLLPQREACDAAADVTSPALYARLVRAAQQELPDGAKLVLGEVAGFDGPKKAGAGAAEFARALPDDVVCAGSVWAQHAYVATKHDLAGDPLAPGAAGLLRDVERALDGRCPGDPLPIWMTETGVDPAEGAGGCEALADALSQWSEDPRVDAAFQYTFREDTLFRTGLADESLTELRPAYAAWRALVEDRLDRSPCEPSGR